MGSAQNLDLVKLRHALRMWCLSQRKCWFGFVFLTFLCHNYIIPKQKGKTPMTISGYTYQIGDLFTTSKTGVTGRIADFTPITNKVTRVSLVLANGSRRLAMVKTSK
jgi:hypothetical protein